MANYDLNRLLDQARSGTLADNDPDLQTLQRHADSGVRSAQTHLSEVTRSRRGTGGSVNKVI